MGVDASVTALLGPAGATPTIIDVAGNGQDLEDSDDPAGVTATAIPGLTDTDLQPDPNAEGAQASYDFGFVLRDYGDAPDPTYPTLLASGGASHLLGSGLLLGAAVNAEGENFIQ